MNILPKKSWHVRNKDNIARVRRDEEQAAQEEKERQRRIALAEQEARTDLLRVRAKKRQRNDDNEYEGEGKQVVTFKPEEHINFFKDLEDGTKVGGTNKEYEEEKRLEKEKQEKSIGLLTYLGQSSLEAQATKPWYLHSHEKRFKHDEQQSSSSSRKTDDEWDAKKKRSLDPMQHMTKYVDIKRKQDELKTGRSNEREKGKKHKHTHKVQHHKQFGEPSPSSSGKKTVEQLRAERLKREKEERQKTERLMAKIRGEKIPGDSKEPVMDDRERRYNSQFNPDFVRKPKKHKRQDYY